MVIKIHYVTLQVSRTCNEFVRDLLVVVVLIIWYIKLTETAQLGQKKQRCYLITYNYGLYLYTV